MFGRGSAAVSAVARVVVATQARTALAAWAITRREVKGMAPPPGPDSIRSAARAHSRRAATPRRRSRRSRRASRGSSGWRAISTVLPRL